jgi:hypothetical protein
MSANDKIREERRPKPVKIVPVVLDETVGKRLAEVGDRKVLSMEKLFASKKAVADLKAAKAAALLAAALLAAVVVDEPVVEEVKEEEKVEPVVEEVKEDVKEEVKEEVKVEPVAEEAKEEEKVELVAEEKPVVLKAVRKPRAKRNIIVDPHAV